MIKYKWSKLEISRRLSLLIPIGCAITLGVVENSRLNYYAVMAMLATSTYSLLINFPFFSKFMHRRPIYFEDLDDPVYHDYYQRVFTRTINIPVAFFAAFLGAYFIYRIKHTELSLFEILGVIGGNLSLYGNLQKRAGQVLIDLLHYLKLRELKRKNGTVSTTTPDKLSNSENTV